jgi:acyl carrier protein
MWSAGQQDEYESRHRPYHGEPPVSATMPLTEQEQQLAQLIVETLNLEVSADEIDPDAPLYGEGLGLDSIDILEMALAISKTYGVQLKSEDENNRKIFASLRRLNEHLQQHRTK